MIAPSETFFAPSLAICAAGSPFATPLWILKSCMSTYMPSLLLSGPSGELELQLSSKLLINGEKAIANVDAATMPMAAAPSDQGACLRSDIAIILSMLVPVRYSQGIDVQIEPSPSKIYPGKTGSF